MPKFRALCIKPGKGRRNPFGANCNNLVCLFKDTLNKWRWIVLFKFSAPLRKYSPHSKSFSQGEGLFRTLFLGEGRVRIVFG